MSGKTGHGVAEAAALLGVSTRTIRRWIRTGRLHAALQPGPNGPQYVIDDTAIHAAARPTVRPIDWPPAEYLSYLRALSDDLAKESANLIEMQALLTETATTLRDAYRDTMAEVHRMLTQHEDATSARPDNQTGPQDTARRRPEFGAADSLV